MSGSAPEGDTIELTYRSNGFRKLIQHFVRIDGDKVRQKRLRKQLLDAAEVPYAKFQSLNNAQCATIWDWLFSNSLVPQALAEVVQPLRAKNVVASEIPDIPVVNAEALQLAINRKLGGEGPTDGPPPESLRRPDGVARDFAPEEPVSPLEPPVVAELQLRSAGHAVAPIPARADTSPTGDMETEDAVNALSLLKDGEAPLQVPPDDGGSDSGDAWVRVDPRKVKHTNYYGANGFRKLLQRFISSAIPGQRGAMRRRLLSAIGYPHARFGGLNHQQCRKIWDFLVERRLVPDLLLTSVNPVEPRRPVNLAHDFSLTVDAARLLAELEVFEFMSAVGDAPRRDASAGLTSPLPPPPSGVHLSRHGPSGSASPGTGATASPATPRSAAAAQLRHPIGLERADSSFHSRASEPRAEPQAVRPFRLCTCKECEQFVPWCAEALRRRVGRLTVSASAVAEQPLSLLRDTVEQQLQQGLQPAHGDGDSDEDDEDDEDEAEDMWWLFALPSASGAVSLLHDDSESPLAALAQGGPLMIHFQDIEQAYAVAVVAGGLQTLAAARGS